MIGPGLSSAVPMTARKDVQQQENGPSSPRSPAEQQGQGRSRSNSHAFLDYVASIRDLT